MRSKATFCLMLFLAGEMLGLAACPAPKEISVFDAKSLAGGQTAMFWDTMHALAALQGLANRDKPQLYLLYCAAYKVQTDQFWLDWLRGEDGWLKETRITPVSSLEQLIGKYKGLVKGLVVYDPEVPATSNLASTAAGCDDLLPVRFSRDTNSLFVLLTQKCHLPVRLWLVNPDGTARFTGKGNLPDFNEPSSGSAKIDAYRWAIRTYIDSGKCDPRFAAYYIDAYWLKKPNPQLHTLCNHDYFIARKSFFFDLSPWGDEAPNDDPQQKLGLDRQTMVKMLLALNQKTPHLIKVGGFVPWPHKYTARTAGLHHEDVATEWEFARLISQFNGYMEADAAGSGNMANASFFAHYPLKKRYPQPNPKPTLQKWQKAGYVTAKGKLAPKLFVGHYVGDYDSPSWLYRAVPAFFNDPARGTVPLGWAFDPNLADRAPQVFAYAYARATTNDFFISGDSGAGYLNPHALTERPDSGLPPALNLWTEHCARYFRQFDMSIAGFVIDGSAGASQELEFAEFKKFSPDGCGNHVYPSPRTICGVPTMREWDLPWTAPEAAAFIAGEASKVTTEPSFLWARSILQTPSWYAEISKTLGDKYPKAEVVVVDPYTFFGLVRLHAQRVGGATAR